MTSWLTLVSSLAAAVIGGLMAPLVTQRRERLALTSGVLSPKLRLCGSIRIATRNLTVFEADAILARHQ